MMMGKVDFEYVGVGLGEGREEEEREAEKGEVRLPFILRPLHIPIRILLTIL